MAKFAPRPDNIIPRISAEPGKSWLKSADCGARLIGVGPNSTNIGNKSVHSGRMRVNSAKLGAHLVEVGPNAAYILLMPAECSRC